MCEANCLASSRWRDRACPYGTWRCGRTGASQELRGPVWQDRDPRAHTKSPGSFRGTRSALPSKIPSVLLATAWPLEKPEAPERNERCARTTIRVEPNEALTGVCKSRCDCPPASCKRGSSEPPTAVISAPGKDSPHFSE